MTGPFGVSTISPVSFGTYLFDADDVTDDGADDELTYRWEVATNNGQQVLSSEQSTFAFSPQFAGTFTVKLTVTDSDGATSAFTQVINVDPIAVINLPISPVVGAIVTVDSGLSSPLALAGGMIGTTLSATRSYAWT